MVCQHLGFKYIELNASDVRSKKSISAKVEEWIGKWEGNRKIQVPALADSHQIDEYLGAKAKDEKNCKLTCIHI